MVQKIESLERRLVNYKAELAGFFIKTVPVVVVGTATLITGALYLLDRFSPNGFRNWGAVSIILVVCISMPALLAFKPARPTEDDVLADQKLRRSHGLDDTIE